jgi:predicted nucleic acid-binding protein
MKHVFLDTNILIDFLSDRKPFSESAAQIISMSENGALNIYISAISFNNIFYILKSSTTNSKLMSLLSELEDIANIIPLDAEILRKSIQSGMKDFEDAIQLFSAMSLKNISVFITRNEKDFRQKLIPVMAPDEALRHLV